MYEKPTLLFGVIALVASLGSPSYAGTCNGTQAIRSIAKDSKTLQLDNGSNWQITRPDLIDPATWLPSTRVLTCDSTLVNLNTNEDAVAHRLR